MEQEQTSNTSAPAAAIPDAGQEQSCPADSTSSPQLCEAVSCEAHPELDPGVPETVPAVFAESLSVVDPMDLPAAAEPLVTPIAMEMPGELRGELEGLEVQAASVAVEEEHTEGGANWMLAFVSFWASVTSLNEAWVVAAAGGFRTAILRSFGFLGYGLLGVGLLCFALEALQWGKRPRSAASIALVFVSALLTVAGIASLVMSPDPGRRI